MKAINSTVRLSRFHTVSQADGGFFWSKEFRPCKQFCMTPRRILRCVTTFDIGNFLRKYILSCLSFYSFNFEVQAYFVFLVSKQVKIEQEYKLLLVHTKPKVHFWALQKHSKQIFSKKSLQ